jgi:hypothetical protein
MCIIYQHLATRHSVNNTRDNLATETLQARRFDPRLNFRKNGISCTDWLTILRAVECIQIGYQWTPISILTYMLCTVKMHALI